MDSEFNKWTTQLEHLAQLRVKQEIAENKADGNPIFYSKEGVPIMELPDGRCFEYQRSNGILTIVREVKTHSP